VPLQLGVRSFTLARGCLRFLICGNPCLRRALRALFSFEAGVGRSERFDFGANRIFSLDFCLELRSFSRLRHFDRAVFRYGVRLRGRFRGALRLRTRGDLPPQLGLGSFARARRIERFLLHGGSIERGRFGALLGYAASVRELGGFAFRASAALRLCQRLVLYGFSCNRDVDRASVGFDPCFGRGFGCAIRVQPRDRLLLEIGLGALAGSRGVERLLFGGSARFGGDAGLSLRGGMGFGLPLRGFERGAARFSLGLRFALCGRARGRSGFGLRFGALAAMDLFGGARVGLCANLRFALEHAFGAGTLLRRYGRFALGLHPGSGLFRALDFGGDALTREYFRALLGRSALFGEPARFGFGCQTAVSLLFGVELGGFARLRVAQGALVRFGAGAGDRFHCAIGFRTR
jgi:hypothetical protein